MSGWRATRLRLLACLAFLALAATAAARVGGGETYGGGGGGGGGGGDGEAIGYLIYLLIRLIIRYPKVGVPLVCLVAVIFYLGKQNDRRAARRAFLYGQPQRIARAQPLRQLREVDRNFSRIVFLDFVANLYTRAMEARPSGDFAALAPYLEEGALATIRRQPAVTEVEGVIVGAIDVLAFSPGGGRDTVVVQLETNLTETRAGSGATKLYSLERWSLARKSGVLSKGPGETRALGCPSCGYTVDLDQQGRCRACGSAVTHGEHGWIVTRIEVLTRRDPSPLALTQGGGKEVGYDHRTRFDPELGAMKRAFSARHPEFDWGKFEERARGIFLALQEAWSRGSARDLRAFETDSLFGQHRYWLDRYANQGLANRLDGVAIEKLEVVRIEPDAFYESITVRIRFSMLDRVVDRDGKVVGGSDREPRQASEYWTFVRTAGQPIGDSSDPRTCPSCGAGLDRVQQSGECGYCGSIITTGEYDWVLALIEQDESYRG